MQHHSPWAETLSNAKARLYNYRSKYGVVDNVGNDPNTSASLPSPIPPGAYSQEGFIATVESASPVSSLNNLSLGQTDAVSVLVLERNNLKRLLTIADKEAKMLQEERKSLEARNGCLEETVRELQAQVDCMSVANRTFSSDLKASTLECESLKRTVHDCRTSLNVSEGEIFELKTQLSEKFNECRIMKSAFEELKKARTELHQQVCDFSLRAASLG